MGSKILVVDDEKLIVKGIKFSLEQDGFEVTAAYDGEEALNYIKEGNFDNKGVFANSYNNGYCKRRGHGQNNGSGIRCRRLYC